MRYCVQCAGLPLAVYREVAAHLCQVNGVKTELVPQQSKQFDYNLSQSNGLWIEFSDSVELACQKQVQRILAYYGDRYGAWEEVNFPGATTVAGS